MKEKKQKLVIDGNAFYELDLDCIRKRNISSSTLTAEKKISKQPCKPQKRQRK